MQLKRAVFVFGYITKPSEAVVISRRLNHETNK
jgi:hypothetical protein